MAGASGINIYSRKVWNVCLIFLPLRGCYGKGLDEVSGWCTDSEKMLWISRDVEGT